MSFFSTFESLTTPWESSLPVINSRRDADATTGEGEHPNRNRHQLIIEDDSLSEYPLSTTGGTDDIIPADELIPPPSPTPSFLISSSRWEEFLQEHSEIVTGGNFRGNRGLHYKRLAARENSKPALLLKEVPSVAALAEGNKTRLSPREHARFERLCEKVRASSTCHKAYKLALRALHMLERKLSNSPLKQAQYIHQLSCVISLGPILLLRDPQEPLKDDFAYQIAKYPRKLQMRMNRVRARFWDVQRDYIRKLKALAADLDAEIEILNRQEAFVLPEDSLNTSLQTLAESLGAKRVLSVLTPYREKINYLPEELEKVTLQEIVNAVELLSKCESEQTLSPNPFRRPIPNAGCVLTFEISQTLIVRYVIEVITDHDTHNSKASKSKVSIRPYLQKECDTAPKTDYYKSKIAKMQLFSEPRLH